MPQEYEQINVGERTHKGKSKIRSLRRDGKEFVLQIDSACFDDEYCRCPDCADEWEKDVEEGIIFS